MTALPFLSSPQRPPRPRVGGLALLLLAALVPSGAVAQATTEELSRAPVFTPMTVRPEILNEAEIVRAMQRAYPPVLRDAGVGGTVQVNFFIDENGAVRNRVIARSSGYQALDQAALDVAQVYRFQPARDRERTVPVWVTFPLTFRVNGAAAVPSPAPSAERAAPAPRVLVSDAEVAARPTFTPMTVRPQILNEAEIVAEMERTYPPMLRDAGIGGTVMVDVYVGVDGRAENVAIQRSSGHQALDDAALRVARLHRFSPARNGDEPVAVWVTFPVTFRR